MTQSNNPAVSLGIAPIGWSNDDLPELGGDIPLERCLREARQAGYAGVEKGGKFPLDEGAGADARRRRAQARLGLVLGRPPRVRQRGRREEAHPAAARPLPGAGLPGAGLRRDDRDGAEPHLDPGRRPPEAPARQRPPLRREADQARGLAPGRGLPDDLPPPHGDGDRDRARDRPADGVDRRLGRPPVRHRPPHLRGRRRPRHAAAARRRA